MVPLVLLWRLSARDRRRAQHEERRAEQPTRRPLCATALLARSNVPMRHRLLNRRVWIRSMRLVMRTLPSGRLVRFTRFGALRRIIPARRAFRMRRRLRFARAFPARQTGR